MLKRIIFQILMNLKDTWTILNQFCRMLLHLLVLKNVMSCAMKHFLEKLQWRKCCYKIVVFHTMKHCIAQPLLENRSMFTSPELLQPAGTNSSYIYIYKPFFLFLEEVPNAQNSRWRISFTLARDFFQLAPACFTDFSNKFPHHNSPKN